MAAATASSTLIAGIAGRDRHAELREQLLGLIFVDVHGRALKQNCGALKQIASRGCKAGGRPTQMFTMFTLTDAVVRRQPSFVADDIATRPRLGTAL